ncbi:MAG TPA: hypothetical protein VFS70_07095 [Actinomycetota bacterium]|nr:hypothetical protein [Actinomycetota bacterium]
MTAMLEALAARDAALVRVRHNADPDWLAAAEAAVRAVARRQQYLTSQNVWSHLRAAGGQTVHEPRAMGAVMRAAAVDRVIEKVDQWLTPTANRVNHGRPMQVWRSLLWGVEAPG